MPSSRDLDRWIVVENFTETVNEFNESEETWVQLTRVRAKRHDVSDKERLDIKQTASSLVSRFIIRSSAKALQIDTKHRLVHDGLEWNILGVKSLNKGRKRFLEITAAAVSS